MRRPFRRRRTNGTPGKSTGLCEWSLRAHGGGQSLIPKKSALSLFHVVWSSCHTLGHFRRPCAGVLFADIRAMYEKDIRLFSAGGKRQQNRRKLEERCRDAAANLPRKRDVNLSHCGNAISRMWSPFGWVRNGILARQETPRQGIRVRA